MFAERKHLGLICGWLRLVATHVPKRTLSAYIRLQALRRFMAHSPGFGRVHITPLLRATQLFNWPSRSCTYICVFGQRAIPIFEGPKRYWGVLSRIYFNAVDYK